MTTSPRESAPRPRVQADPGADPALLLRSPDALVSALPYLLGFAPRESAVLVWLRNGRILLTQRLDLPPAGAALGPWSAAVWAHAAAPQADEVILVVVSGRSEAADVVDLVADEAADRGIHLRDAIRLDGDRWWSYLCEDASCCGPTGRPVDVGVRLGVAAEFALRGTAPLPDREALVATMAGDVAAAEAVGAIVQTLVAPVRSRRALERWRDQSIELVLAACDDSGMREGTDDVQGPEENAALIAAVSDMRVRDTVLWEVTRLDPEGRRATLDRLLGAMRCAPDGFVAPIATCCGLIAWLCGDGARAVTAIDRALADDPSYSLAGLLAQSLSAGLPPEAWLDATAGLTRDECRHGYSDRSGAGRRAG